jgi:hypothetical protein
MHLFRAVYATIAVYFYCPQQVNATLFKAEIQGHRMVADASKKRALRSYSASRHYNDYYVAGSNGNADGRQGVRLGEPGVQLLEVFQTPPLPTQAPTPAKPEPKFDGSTASATPPSQQQQSPPPVHQPPVAEAHPTPPTPSSAPTETASVPVEPAAAAVPAPCRSCRRTASRKDSAARRWLNPDQTGASRARRASGSGYQPQLRQGRSQTGSKPSITSSQSTTLPTTPPRKWVINESILGSLTGCFEAGYQKIL